MRSSEGRGGGTGTPARGVRTVLLVSAGAQRLHFESVKMSVLSLFGVEGELVHELFTEGPPVAFAEADEHKKATPLG